MKRQRERERERERESEGSEGTRAWGVRNAEDKDASALVGLVLVLLDLR